MGIITSDMDIGISNLVEQNKELFEGREQCNKAAFQIYSQHFHLIVGSLMPILTP